MRLLILGASGPGRTEQAVARAARQLGHDCRLIDPGRWRRRLGPLGLRLVRRMADRFAPDLVLLTRRAAAAGDLGTLLQGRASAFWYFDAVTPLPDEVCRLARQTDRSFATYQFQLEALVRAGAAEAHFLPQAADPHRDRPAAPRSRYACQVSFVGSGQYSRRYPVLQAVGRVADLQVRGPNWRGAPLTAAGGKVSARQLPTVIASAGINLGINALPFPATETGGATSDRLWRVLAAGGFYLGERVPGIEAFPEHGIHAVWYDGRDDAVRLVRHWLTDPEGRHRIAAEGRALVLARHTYAHRLPLLLAGRGYTST